MRFLQKLHLCVKRCTVFSGLVTVTEQTKKRSMTTDDEIKTETEARSKNTHLQLQIVGIGAAKDKKMKIFEIITLKIHSNDTCKYMKFSQIHGYMVW